MKIHGTYGERMISRGPSIYNTDVNICVYCGGVIFKHHNLSGETWFHADGMLACHMKDKLRGLDPGFKKDTAWPKYSKLSL